MEIEITSLKRPGDQWDRIEPLLRAIHEYHAPLTGVPLLPTWHDIQRRTLDGLAEALILIARSDGEDVGFLNGWISRNPALFAETFARVDNLYVDEWHRGRGLGQRLLREFETWAAEHDVAEIRLGVVASNELGIRFWEAAGFETAIVYRKKSMRRP